MGVEPTRRRVAPPTGFEARPIHQDRFPSVMRDDCSVVLRSFSKQSAVGAKTVLVCNPP